MLKLSCGKGKLHSINKYKLLYKKIYLPDFHQISKLYKIVYVVKKYKIVNLADKKTFTEFIYK